MKPKLRIVPLEPFAHLSIEVMDPGEDRFHRYFHGTEKQVDEVLRELQPEDGEVVFDIREAA